MSTTRFVALLRGINVGGKNIIPMAELRACFEAMKFARVGTYIQSGNVLFDAPAGDPDRLEGRIERALARRFKLTSRVVVLSREELRRVIRDAPAGFGENAAKFRYDVMFLKRPLTAAKAAGSISLKPGVDASWPGKGVVYFSRLTVKATQSRLSRITQLPIYQQMTIRNWNTTTRLLALLDG
jgi:uncharacterized protein (DUF1697 family)